MIAGHRKGELKLMALKTLSKHLRIIGALMMREMSTRFGREGLGFAWLVLEPLSFCFGVIILWTATKPEYEHGIRVSAFTMTGYMCVLLLRHQISYTITALPANMGLLHHRFVTPVHIVLARNVLEFAGATMAFIIVYAVLFALGQVSLPHNYILLYSGWLLLGWVGMGTALLLAGAAMRFEVLERMITLLMYVLVPLSGAFFMIAWVPANIAKIFLYLPFPHPIEMLRAGVFGEFVKTTYHTFYAFMFGAVMNALGLLLIAISRDRLDVE